MGCGMGEKTSPCVQEKKEEECARENDGGALCRR